MRQALTGPLIVALDVGTTGVRALLVDAAGTVRANAYREALPICPGPGLVEHPTEDLFGAIFEVLGEALRDTHPRDIRGLGLSSQRATAVVWDTASGRAVHPAISWQDGRTAARCTALLEQGVFVSPLAAATKIEWILDRVDPERHELAAGRLRCGTLDAWLVQRLTGRAVQATDGSHASCSGLYDFATGGWSPHVAEALRIPLDALPAIVDSGAILAPLDRALGLPAVPLAAVIGDQQSAMMGQLRLVPGEVKITYGTAAMIDLNVGAAPLFSMEGAYPLVLWQRDGRPTFCLEGTAITAGASITWLRDNLGIITTPAECDAHAASVPDSAGVWAVPAFQGLGTPYMETQARAVIGGLTRAATRAHIIRAVLEGIAWRCREVYDALRKDCPFPAPATLRADGGAARSDVLLQAQADALGLPVERPAVLQASALGAAYLAGLSTGVWTSPAELAGTWHCERTFTPRLSTDEREDRFAAWRRHLEASRGNA